MEGGKTMTEKLKPCPFCGGEAKVMHMDLDSIEEGWKVWGVWCVDDLNAEDYRSHGHYIDNYATEAEAIAAWNTRAEQAIAATLGSDRVTENSIDKWMREFQLAHGELAHIGPDELRELAFALHDDIPLGYEASMRLADWLLHTTLGGGKLTAEQAREAIFNGSVYASYDGTQYYASGIDMQVIADELNATLGEADEGCYLVRDGKKFPVELDCGFVGIMPIAITVAGFRYLLEVPNGE